MKGLSRARWGALCASVGLLIVGLSIAGPPAKAATNSLSNWTKQGATGAGTWTVAADGNSVTQTINGAPSFFVSPFIKESATFEVDITPATSSDNDYVGLVLGYSDPLGAESTQCGSQNCTNSYILVDWKQEVELGEQAGFSLMQVNGDFDVRDPNGQLPCFWTHDDTQTCDVLATAYGDLLGWVEGAVNTLRVTYGPGNIKVESIRNGITTTIFDRAGVYPTGRVGLYNYSQANVLYAVRDLAEPTSSSSTSSSSTSTTTTTVAPTSTTARTPTTLAATIVRTGPADTARAELALGAALIVVGAVLMATRGKRPLGRHFS